VSFDDGLETPDTARPDGPGHTHTTRTKLRPREAACGSATRLANVMVALVCCLQLERARDGCDDNVYMTRVREAVRESCCVVGERLWNDDAFEDAL
jgi:hypothetical protein